MTDVINVSNCAHFFQRFAWRYRNKRKVAVWVPLPIKERLALFAKRRQISLGITDIDSEEKFARSRTRFILVSRIPGGKFDLLVRKIFHRDFNRYLPTGLY